MQYQCRRLSTSAWIADFVKRLEQLKRVIESADYRRVSLGLLFHPRGFVTGSRQAISHATQCSLERLSLQVNLESTGAPNSFVIEGTCLFLILLGLDTHTMLLLTIGFSLVGATHSSDGIRLNDGSLSRLSASSLQWVATVENEEPSSASSQLRLPCHLDESREEMLFVVEVGAAEDMSSIVVAQQGICLVLA